LPQRVWDLRTEARPKNDLIDSIRGHHPVSERSRCRRGLTRLSENPHLGEHDARGLVAESDIARTLLAVAMDDPVMRGDHGGQHRLRVRTWGTRGSLPVSGEQVRIFGGSTICTEVRCGDQVLLFDAGSGLLPAGCALKSEGVRAAHLFFGHSHYDHIIGLPFFPMMFDPGARVEVWSGHLAGKMTTREIIDSFLRPPWFPVEPEVFCCGQVTHDFRAGDVLQPYEGVTVRTASLAHPGGCIGYRVEWSGRAVAIITDTEHAPGGLDPAVLGLIDGCDLFLYDSAFTEAEMASHRGFGHSTWDQAVLLARQAGARQVGFIHHAPGRTDAELLEMEAQARLVFPACFFARDGQIIDL
jgi:phosphoribosyl 1,2-cyclic phosphodiesterase